MQDGNVFAVRSDSVRFLFIFSRWPCIFLCMFPIHSKRMRGKKMGEHSLKFCIYILRAYRCASEVFSAISFVEWKDNCAIAMSSNFELFAYICGQFLRVVAFIWNCKFCVLLVHISRAIFIFLFDARCRFLCTTLFLSSLSSSSSSLVEMVKKLKCWLFEFFASHARIFLAHVHLPASVILFFTFVWCVAWNFHFKTKIILNSTNFDATGNCE